MSYALPSLAFKSGKRGAKAKFQLSQLFYNSGFICCTYAAETRDSEAATDYKLWPLFACSRNSACDQLRS
jgi:hypothetical protein